MCAGFVKLMRNVKDFLLNQTVNYFCSRRQFFCTDLEGDISLCDTDMIVKNVSFYFKMGESVKNATKV